MSERVLTSPLSGLEVRNAILDRIGKRLEKDCYLSPNLAYDGFDCKIKIELTCHDVGRAAEVKVEEKVQQGELNEDAYLDKAESEFEINTDNPNQERVETGQPVPVLTKEGGKQEIRGVRYSRKAATKQA